MARPLRIAFEGAFYHVTDRGNERRKIFLTSRDYEKFLSYLAETLHRCGAILHALVLMPNHYHLLVETPKANLTPFMHNLNSAYTTYFNRKRKRSGHLFQGRYKALLVDADSYLLELSRYIHLNPVRAGMTVKPEAYPYSSYRAYMMPKEETPVYRDLFWSMVTQEKKKGPQKYQEFVEAALKEKPESPFGKIYGGVILGGKKFIEETLERLEGTKLEKKEISYGRFLGKGAPDMDEIVNGVCDRFKISREQARSASPYKGYAVYLARKHTPYSNAEIGRYFGGISYSAVTKIGTRIKDRMRRDKKMREEIAELEKRLSRVKG